MVDLSIIFLRWDSNFFNKKIGKFDYAQSTIEIQLEKAKQENYDLIYVFSEENSKFDAAILKKYGGKLVDQKVVYEKTFSDAILSNKLTNNIVEVKELTNDLEQLAYLSGEFSRFKTDKNFDGQDFYRMYKVWIEKSIQNEIAGWVFAALHENSEIGMVTLKVQDNIGHIGLISVSSDAQRKGIGKGLIQVCEEKLKEMGVLKLEVPTQKENRKACDFYERCGFTIKSITNIYHFWL